MPQQNGHYFAEDIYKYTFLEENVSLFIEIRS